MTITSELFRETFPKFNAVQFETPQIDMYIGVAASMLDPARWGDLLDYGTMLFVAHNLALDAMDGIAGGAGVGQIVGPKTSANVDRVGYSRDPNAAMELGAGHWNLTSFGLRYIRLAKIIGAGPIQIGVGVNDTNVGYSGGWPGVIVGNTPSG